MSDAKYSAIIKHSQYYLVELAFCENQGEAAIAAQKLSHRDVKDYGMTVDFVSKVVAVDTREVIMAKGKESKCVTSG